MRSRPHIVLLAAAAAALLACATATTTQRARALVRQHREAAAVTLLEERLRKHPEDVAARRLLIRLLGLTGNLPEARAQVEDLVQWSPAGDPTPYLELGHALELAHQYDDALAAYDEAARAAPFAPDGPREGGMRAARWGELDQAAPRLEEAIRRGGGHDGEVWHALGLVRLNEGDYDAAFHAYREGLLADPRGASNWLGLATVAVARQDPAAALQAYDAVLALVPKFADAELGRAWALGKLGRKKEAREALDHAQELGAPAVNITRQIEALERQ